MAGEENNTQQQTGADAVAMLLQLIGGGTTGSATSGVYLGQTGTKTVRMKKTGQAISVPQSKVLSIQEANKLYLTDPKLQTSWRKTMQRNGLETGNPVTERKAWEVAVAGAADWYTTSNGTAKVTPEQYLTWWAGGQKKKKPAVPTRQVYNITPEQIDSDINDIAMKTLGRTIQAEDKNQDWYQDLVKGVQKLYARGVVTEPAKLVKNPKTGKMERVVGQTPEFSKEKVTSKIEEAVKGAAPVDVERKERVDFTKWLYSQMGGQG